jgi:hypothetical protein
MTRLLSHNSLHHRTKQHARFVKEIKRPQLHSAIGPLVTPGFIPSQGVESSGLQRRGHVTKQARQDTVASVLRVWAVVLLVWTGNSPGSMLPKGPRPAARIQGDVLEGIEALQ